MSVNANRRATNFQLTFKSLQHRIYVADSTGARIKARSLINQLLVISQEYPDMTIKQLLTPIGDRFE